MIHWIRDKEIHYDISLNMFISTASNTIIDCTALQSPLPLCRGKGQSDWNQIFTSLFYHQYCLQYLIVLLSRVHYHCVEVRDNLIETKSLLHSLVMSTASNTIIDCTALQSPLPLCRGKRQSDWNQICTSLFCHEYCCNARPKILIFSIFHNVTQYWYFAWIWDELASHRIMLEWSCSFDYDFSKYIVNVFFIHDVVLFSLNYDALMMYFHCLTRCQLSNLRH